MTNRPFEASVADWLQEGPDTGPRHGLDRALAAMHRVEQRPAWVFPRRYLPRPLAGVDLRIPASVPAVVVLVLTLLLLVALALALVGTPARIRLPFMPAADRPIAFQDGPAIFTARLDGSERHKISGDVPYAISPMFSIRPIQFDYIRSHMDRNEPNFLVDTSELPGLNSWQKNYRFSVGVVMRLGEKSSKKY